MSTTDERNSEAVGHCVIHGDYYSEDCMRCAPSRAADSSPHGSTQPSAEAIEAAAKMMKAGEAQGHSIAARAHDVTFAALRVDAPAIYATGVQEGGAAMLREVVEWAGTYKLKTERGCRMCGSRTPRDVCGKADRISFGCLMTAVVTETWPDAIEARFPSKGTG